MIIFDSPESGETRILSSLNPSKDPDRKKPKDDEKPVVAVPPVSEKKEEKEKSREANWRLEIERKVRQEAAEKDIELTAEQFQKVCERRMKKLTKKLAEKKHRKESSKTDSEQKVEKVDKAPKTPIQSPTYDTPLSLGLYLSMLEVVLLKMIKMPSCKSQNLTHKATIVKFDTIFAEKRLAKNFEVASE